jgi:hypothetical protein
LRILFAPFAIKSFSHVEYSVRVQALDRKDSQSGREGRKEILGVLQDVSADFAAKVCSLPILGSEAPS